MAATLSVALALSIAAHAIPAVSPDTIITFACQESGNTPCTALDPLAIHDNDTGTSYHPDNEAAAVQLARHLVLHLGHSTDLGALQVNFRGPTREGLSIDEAFTPSRSIATGGAILVAAWQACQATYNAPRALMACAAARYNAGKESAAGQRYAAHIWQVAAQVVPSIGKIVSADFSVAAPGTSTPGARPNTMAIATAKEKPKPDPDGESVFAHPESGREIVLSEVK
jgi:type IV secretion system protein VirB1